MNIRAKLKSAYSKLAEMLTRKAYPGHFESMNLHPSVLAAFRASQRPVERRATESVMGRTSWGRNWFPRDRAYFPWVEDLLKHLQLPKTSPFTHEVTLQSGRVYLMRHGTRQRVDRLFPAAA